MMCMVEFSTSELYRHTVKAAVAVGLFAMVAAIGSCGTGCAGFQTPTAKEQAYTAEIVGCATVAKTKKEDHDCRVRVNRRYGLCEGSGVTAPTGDCE